MKSRNRRALRVEQLETRTLLAGDTYLVNFQHDEATTPVRYLRDHGLAFSMQTGGYEYGWTVDHSDSSAERSAAADQRLDTLIQIKAGQAWEFALDSGQYEVTVAVGDPANNDGVHTIVVEGNTYWTAESDGDEPLVQTQTVSVADGRLTIGVGAAGDLDTRINYVQIVGVPDGPNSGPVPPTIMEPAEDRVPVNPADVHMEAIGFFDLDGDLHKSSDWEIWTTGDTPEMVWQTLGIQGVEKLHTHLGDGIFTGSQAGETALAENTDYQLRVRFRDDAGAVSDYALRDFSAGAASTIFPLKVQDVLIGEPVSWTDLNDNPIDLGANIGILTPDAEIIPIDSGGNSGSPGAEGAGNAIDRTLDKYLNFGDINGGFIVTPTSGLSLVNGFRIVTANDFEPRDPSHWVLYGTNDPITSEPHSRGNDEDWTLIDSGSLSLPAARDTAGELVSVDNTTPFSSYRMIFTDLKGGNAAGSMQIAEIQFYGDAQVPPVGALLAGDDAIRAIDLDGNSESPNGETAEFAIDGTLEKYLNFGKENSGFIVTPSGGASVVTGFQITTANDDADRDPQGWEIYGTNDTVTSANHSDGEAENWTLIASGSVTLPNARDTPGPEVEFTNSDEYTSYRMVFTSLKDSGGANSMQLAEIQFFGDFVDATVPAFQPPSLLMEAGDTGEDFLLIEYSDLIGNVVMDFPPLESDADVRLVLNSGSAPLSLPATNLLFTDNLGIERTIFLPEVELAAFEELHLWVSIAGGTYYGQPGQTAPDFSTPARDSAIPIPFIVNKPNFVIERVGADYRLPVNIAFVPDPGPEPDDPLYFVTELYGSIQVVTRDGTKHEFASGLLDYNPTGPISGSGEQGLTGITVVRDELDSEVYHLYVGMLWDNGDPAGDQRHYPKVERISSSIGGLSLDSREVLLNMQPETQGQSHQISNISIGPDGNLYVHVGDGFDASTALDMSQFRGKILRMSLEGDPLPDNPFYSLADGIGAEDYIYAYGFRNPFGGAWRSSDGKLYEVENGPSVDRLAQVNPGVSYGWTGSDESMEVNALYNWSPASAPVNLAFVQTDTFSGSMYPASMMDHLFVSQSGATYATGPQGQGKQITEFVLDENGDVVEGPTPFVQYIGSGKSSVVALAAGPDGLYFSTLYEDSGAEGPTAAGAEIYRIRYVDPLDGDYDVDGDVDQDDYAVWKANFGLQLPHAADGNGNGRVDLADYVVWRNNLGATLTPPAATQSSQPIVAASSSSTLVEGTSSSLAANTAPTSSSTSDTAAAGDLSTGFYQPNEAATKSTGRSGPNAAFDADPRYASTVFDYWALEESFDKTRATDWLDELACDGIGHKVSTGHADGGLKVYWNQL